MQCTGMGVALRYAGGRRAVLCELAAAAALRSDNLNIFVFT